MTDSGTSMIHKLSDGDIGRIRELGVPVEHAAGTPIFAEGDEADSMYFIESGRLAVSIRKFTRDERISVLGPGDLFGEMALCGDERRTASVKALDDARLLRVDKQRFLGLIAADGALALAIERLKALRRHELSLKEDILADMGLDSACLHVGIKGDPSLRESAFDRGRYESVVDRVLPQLQPRLQELLLERDVCELAIHFNSGEIQTTSVFDPFDRKIHPADKLVSGAYIERHFPRLDFDDKLALVAAINRGIAAAPQFAALPAAHRQRLGHDYQRPTVEREDVVGTISKLTVLRAIPDFYLRNLTVSVTQRAIRMQFNCDGTHIVDAAGYRRFIEDNI